MGFFDVVLSQRACRRFADDTVADADVARMLEAATHAPSAENTQPWVFVVVRDAERRRTIDEITARLWTGGGRAIAERTLAARMLTDVDAFFCEGYGGAPVLVVVAGDARAGTTKALLAASVFPAVQNLLLAATALGLGSSMTTIATFAADELSTAVGLPEGVVPLAVVPVGWPARPLGPPRRRPVSEVAHRDHFGRPFETK